MPTTQGSFSTQEAATQALNTAITTVGAGTLTGAALAGTVVTRSGPTAAYTDTTDTAANILAALTSANIGESFEVTIKNTVAFDCTLAGGTGMTLSGQTIIPGLSWGRFLVTIATATTGTMQGLATGPLASLPDAKFTTGTAATHAAGDITGAKHVHYTNTGNNATITTRTATQMFGDTPNAQVGQSYVLSIRNEHATGVTVTAGTGVTLTGTMTIANTVTRTFVVTFTSSTALTIQSIGLSAAGA